MNLKSLFIQPKFPENLAKLHELAGNLWCTWNHDTIGLFYRIDAHLFRTTNHNPMEFLLNLPPERIHQLSEDQGFLFELDQIWQRFQQYMRQQEPYTTPSGATLAAGDTIAYFSMEFGLHESIPIYSGGLGVLSGDFLKAASDLNLPLLGIGLVYKYGYFTQRINMQGQQQEQFLEFDNHLIPMREVRGPEGEKLFIEIPLLDQVLRAKLWRIEVGKTHLILLDTDIEENPAKLRDITRELYVADRTKRLQQELLLGIGGVQAIARLGIEPRIFHINEGHSAFLILARLEKLMRGNGLGFTEAKAIIRASTVFTTHTPVIAGNENFDTSLVQQYLEKDVESLGLAFDDFASHAFINGDTRTFWLPAFAIRFSRYVNAVSRMHGDVSRRMWAGLFPGRTEIELPIGYITNGVHHSWLSEPFADLLSRHIGPDYAQCVGEPQRWKQVQAIHEEEIWQAHHRNKQSLLMFVRKKLADDLAARGYIEPRILKLTRALNPEYLTIVYARRFARYKRATLILRDKDRLAKILRNPARPVQILFAGKAHPADSLGKGMIREILDFARSYGLEDRVIFLENYDMNVARHLAWGADVWLNNPVKENEASGTSGMKAGMNGVLNLSVPDGWWPEAYNGRNGWVITGSAYDHQIQMQEVAEAEQIYELIEEQITEMYYDRNEAGVPVRWVEMMKESIASVCCRFNMNRVLTEYVDNLYAPSRALSATLSQDNRRALKLALDGEQDLVKRWESISVTDFSTSLDNQEVVTEGDRVEVTCTVALNGMPPDSVQMELFCVLPDRREHQIVPMQPHDARGRLATYRCEFEATGRGLLNMNARVRPTSPILQDLHPELIKWAQP